MPKRNPLQKATEVYPVKNNKNQVTHVFIPSDIYQEIMREVAEYQAIQQQKGIKWVKVAVNRQRK